jgi:hypothetical protein
VSSSGITLDAGSGRTFTLSLLDKLNGPVDFGTGTWRADLSIVDYPGDLSAPFAILSSVAGTGLLQWLTLANSSLILTPDPTITSGWTFYKYHYDLTLKGPNVGSKTERIDHGPFRLVK